MKNISYFLKDINLYNIPKEENSSKKFSPETIENQKFSTVLSDFWKRLVLKPHSFPQKPQISISKILEEEKGILASNQIKFVLSKKLELPLDSKELLAAMDNSCKIFHEDFPGDFILEYQDERLGMMMLDICFDSHNQAKPVYKFNPRLKSFQGLF